MHLVCKCSAAEAANVAKRPHMCYQIIEHFRAARPPIRSLKWLTPLRPVVALRFHRSKRRSVGLLHPVCNQ